MNEIPQTPWGSLGYITYKRTYARRLDGLNPDSPTEEYYQTVDRVLNAAKNQLKCNFSEEEEERLRNYFLTLKCSVAGRFLWQLGTETVNKLGLASLQNCAVTLVNQPIVPFVWAMDMLMLGSGVGYNIQREYVYQIPPVKGLNSPIRRVDEKDSDFIVPDKREGWVNLLRKVLQSYFITGKGFTYSAFLIRGKDALIKGFGGVSSGPEELCWGIGEICKLLDKRKDKKLRSIDALDIMNIIGSIVVSGNVRRSAQLAIGDYDDIQYLNAKRWDLGNIPNWRAMSNNSVVCNNINDLPEQFWKSYYGNGEPYGLINLNLSKKVGRLKETQYPDPLVIGYNPCAEQSLEDKETCCLAEIFLPNIESKAQLIDVAKLIYRVNKHSLMLDCHLKDTEKVVHKNMRMGIGITGIMMCSDEQISWLSECYVELRKFDEQYSNQIGVNKSIKLTTVKPSGTLSLLAGVTPGVHPGFSKFHIRRITISSNSPLVEVCRKSGYPIEYRKNLDGSDDYKSVIVSFPCKFPDNTTLAKDLSAIKQLEKVTQLQTLWSDNAVSCTVYYKLEELAEIKEWLKNNYNDNIKSVSFLLHSDHGFVQAPLEEITEEKYLEMVNSTIPITNLAVINENEVSGVDECSNGACPIK